MEKIREEYRELYQLEKDVGIFFCEDQRMAEIFPIFVN
jgi:hypothetical protein